MDFIGSWNYSFGFAAPSIAGKELVIKILSVLEVPFENSVIETNDRPSKDFSYFMDTKKAKTCLQWKPLVSLEEGIKSTIEWVNHNYGVLSKMPCSFLF